MHIKVFFDLAKVLMAAIWMPVDRSAHRLKAGAGRAAERNQIARSANKRGHIVKRVKSESCRHGDARA